MYPFNRDVIVCNLRSNFSEIYAATITTTILDYALFFSPSHSLRRRDRESFVKIWSFPVEFAATELPDIITESTPAKDARYGENVMASFL